jgi:uncharacterized protein YdaU (DUF1376 family)
MSNRELPMMPWYPDQFAASTAAWTWIERAVYRALLDAQWALGALPQSEARLSKLVGMPSNGFRKAWRTVKEKFPPDPRGGLRNVRLEEHRLSALARKQARVNAGRLGGVAKAKQSSSNAMSLPQANPYPPSPSPSEEVREDPSDFPPSGKDELPDGGGTPRENGTNPRALGTNPRAQGTNPRAVRNRSLELWRETTAAIDQVASTAALPQGQRLTWAYVAEQIHDPAALSAIEKAGGFRAIADRDRFTQSDYESRFREAYEQQLRQDQHA